MLESFGVVEDWPPQDVRIMQPDRVRHTKRRSPWTLIVVLVAAAGMASGLYLSGAGPAVLGVRTLELCCTNAFSGERIQYGSPEINVFRSTDKYPPLAMHEIQNPSRWTVTVLAVRDPVGTYISWEHRMSRENAGRGRGVPFQPFTLAPGENMYLYFVGDPWPCVGTVDRSLTSTASSDGLLVTYRMAGITRRTLVPGHRYVAEKQGC
jgi:hypothetical protein